jgi:outer membrane protein assembly factor BamD (BamD/ComL family)
MKHPIDLYVEAQDNLREGKRDEAAEKLSQALGSDKVTQPIKNGIDKLLYPGTYAHEVVLGIMESEIRRTRNDR